MKLNFGKNVPRNVRQYLRKSLAEYESKTSMSAEERQKLYAWVSDGNDVCSNPSNLAFDSGREMDFISGIRTVDEFIDLLTAAVS